MADPAPSSPPSASPAVSPATPGTPAPSLLSGKLAQFASIAAEVVGVLTGTLPVISSVEGLVGVVEKIIGDLRTVPLDATGQPVTLDAASAHLTASQAASKTQDDRIRAESQAALDENQKNG